MPSPLRLRTTVELGALHEPLLAACKARGVNPSEAIRGLVADSLSDAKADRETPVGRELPRVVDRGTRRVEIRLTDSEYSLAKSVAAADGFTLARWISALVRSRLGGGQQLGEMELQALAESSYQLRAVGRNLNQITRAINAGNDAEGRSQLAIVGELSEQIDRHLGKVGRLLESNIERWKLERR